MDVSQADWIKYKDELAAISEKAAQNLETWLTWKGGYQNVSKKDLIDMAYALATRYGEATASLAAEMYDETAALSGVSVPSAEVADTASYGEIAKAINGVTKTVTTDSNLGNVVARYVKRAGADTTLKNVERDGAQFAWIPAGDTCAFCLTLASNGWQYQSKNAMKNGHASHIHANCDCTYAVRFDNKTNVKGYNPEKYREMYYNAEGKTPQERINSMRRIHYQENRDKILAQKKANRKEHLENEESNKKRKSLNQNTLVPQGMLTNSNYQKRIMDLVGDVKESRGIYKCAKEILSHRNGTLFEDLGFYNTKNNKLLFNKSFDYYKDGVSACKPNKRMRKMLKKANENEIIGIHNHPQSSGPSLADIKKARERRYKYGIVLCHNGQIYKYSVDKDINDEFAASFYLANLGTAVYNNDKKETERIIKVLGQLGIRMEVG